MTTPVDTTTTTVADTATTVAATTTAAAATTTIATALPETGQSNGWIALVAAGAVAAGLVAVALSRRHATPTR